MAKFVNKFSWSHSAAGDFEDCRRKRYWSKYASWGGWERNAPTECRTAYRLNKMSNRFAVQGEAAEQAVMWLLREHQGGRTRTAQEAFDTVAKPLLRRAWDESNGKVWSREPKAYCLHEHYYPAFHEGTERERMVGVADTVKACLANFLAGTLPRLSDVRPDEEIPIAVVGQGDAEHFDFEGVKIYAIPDYVYVRDGIWHIVDWKSGKPKPEHAAQVGLYALWANAKHGVAADRIHLCLEYLQTGERAEFDVHEGILEEARERVRESVQDMAQYLEDADPSRNLALPKDEWDLAYDPALCRRCPFYELCRPELDGLLD